jgi:hypothetical protein
MAKTGIKADKDKDKDELIVKPPVDAYTGMLVISLLALIAGGVLLWLDFSRYPNVAAPKGAPARAPAVGPQTPGPAPVDPGKDGNPADTGKQPNPPAAPPAVKG